VLPGKRYTPDDILRLAWKRRWYIVIPLIVIASTTAVVAMFLPNRYQASTSIVIIPQRVPENFVRSTVTADLSQRLSIISKQILSRTRLERIVQEFNLYEGERRGAFIMEDIIEQMRNRDISLNVNASGGRDASSSFSVSYQSADPRTAMRVTERLASLFVQENLEDRELLADQTNQFLQVQLEEAKRRLVEKEDALKQFRMRNNGVLPDQVTANLQMMQTAQMQLQGVLESNNRDQDRLTMLERNLAEATASAIPVAMTSAPSSGEPFAGTATQQLEIARANLRALELRLKPEHPDIGRAKRVIAELEAKAEAEALNQPLSQTSASMVVDKAAQARIENLRNDIQELRQRIASGKREAARLQETAQGHAARVQAAPALEAQLTELMRDYTTFQDGYTSLLRKSEDSKIAVNLERRQIGEQFRILDGARLPERPISPNRGRINLLGILAGLGVGIGLVALLEYRDSSFKTDDDIVSTLALPVLAVIPIMTNAGERRAVRRRRLLLAASASIGCMVIAATVMVVLKLRLVEAWFR
jgi:polysaccharide chain length determinant protein (PEP-CTERM system associated)